MVSNKEEVLQHIFDSGFFASSHYMSLAKIFGESSAPIAERVHSKIINLFNDFRFTSGEAKEVAKIVSSIGR